MYYVYAHTKPSGEIFYIGKGVKSRVYDPSSRNRHWNFVREKYGYKPVILAEFEDEQQALNEEILLISHFRKFGKLTNITDGGDINPMYTPSVAKRVAATKRAKGQYSGDVIRQYNIAYADKIKNDSVFAKKVSEDRKKAKIASNVARIEKMRLVVIEIRQLRIDGWLLKDLAVKFGMRESTISNIVNRKCYASIP
jgi:hypothetical protein